MKGNKKGQTAWNALAAAGLGVGVFILIVAIMAQVLAQIAETQETGTCPTNVSQCSASYNLTHSGILAMALFGDWAGIVVIVAIAGIVITLLVLAFRQFS